MPHSISPQKTHTSKLTTAAKKSTSKPLQQQTQADAAGTTSGQQSQHANTPLTYQQSGVDIDRADQLVKRIGQLAKTTHRPETLAGIGGFAALCQVPLDRYQQPVLVSGTDGVGTKLKLAQRLEQHQGIGIDLVAMCVNDIITQGAEPLFFLDYFACGTLDPAQAEQVIAGIAEGCKQAKMSLLGGETAEMPGMYRRGEYDLAGFCVGVAERDAIIDGSQVQIGDAIIGLSSSGLHSNGYALVNRILEQHTIDMTQNCGHTTLAAALLTPTIIYVEAIAKLQAALPLHAIAHITGGGLIDNIPRVLPKHCAAALDRNSWCVPEIFQWLQQHGPIDADDMWRTFNMGIGMVIVVPQHCAQDALMLLADTPYQAQRIGTITTRTSTQHAVKWHDKTIGDGHAST